MGNLLSLFVFVPFFKCVSFTGIGRKCVPFFKCVSFSGTGRKCVPSTD